MKLFLKLLLIPVYFTLVQCSENDPEPLKPESSKTQDSKTEPTINASQNNAGTFPDSAFYRSESFDGMPYQIMFPRKYDATQKYPIVIFLHGIAERGTDNQQQLKVGASIFQAESVSRQYPSFVVFPQCPVSNYWFDDDMLSKLKNMVDDLVNTHSIDPNRIYIEGLSMGAYGTYAMVAKYPELFAAAVAMAGDGDEKKAKQMAKVNWKIYGGKKDTKVAGEKSEKMAEALKRSGATVSLTIYPDANHADTWTRAFQEPDYFSWVFEKVKK